jgi:nitroimidazol reductase NimA-like FMN-containing flavoprotein (pyridoxamine 5'-phosphate oxidase superfamily)
MKTYALNDPSVQRFLAELTTVVLATINPDGSPLATPVLFVHDDTHLAMVSVDELRKVKNLRRDPRASIAAQSVHSERSACLMIKGVASFAQTPADHCKNSSQSSKKCRPWH